GAARGRLLPRRARLRRTGAPARGRLSVGGRVSPPHRAELLAEPRRRGPAGSRARPTRDHLRAPRGGRAGGARADARRGTRRTRPRRAPPWVGPRARSRRQPPYIHPALARLTLGR